MRASKRDYYDLGYVQPKAIGESWLETIAAGLAAICLVVLLCLTALFFSV